MRKDKSGSLGEEIAQKYLQKRGFILLDKNYRSAGGELDILCKKDNTIHCFEVKTLSSFTDIKSHQEMKERVFRPEDHYTAKKERNVLRAFLFYLEKKYGSTDIPHHMHLISLTLYEKEKRVRIRVFWNVSSS
jgi:Holliday junction resolvase-like predicted endonuclease